MILALKLLVLATWFTAAAGFLWPGDTTFGQLGRILFGLLAVTHAVECAFFLPTLRKTGRPLGFEIAQTLFYGVIHYAEVKAALLANAEPGEESAG